MPTRLVCSGIETESEPRRVACAKRIEDGEHFFGFGERTGPLDKLGRQLINWTTDPAHGHGPGTDPLYHAIPVFHGAPARSGLRRLLQ